MEVKGNIVVGELVAENYKAASVFKSFGIDFCCRGNISIQEACEKGNINVNELLIDLNQVLVATTSEEDNYKSWELDSLAEHIEVKHHAYVDSAISEIKPYLDKIMRVHGEAHPELVEINKLFNEAAGELTAHMKKEELILFPFIKKMAIAKREGAKVQVPHFNTVENPIHMMKEDHDGEGVRFRKISELSNNYTPPADGCGTYQVTFALLKEFENDLHRHIHLENNILFPKAIALEKSVVQ